MPLENQELNHCQEKHEFLKLDNISWVSFEEEKKRERNKKKSQMPEICKMELYRS